MIQEFEPVVQVALGGSPRGRSDFGRVDGAARGSMALGIAARRSLASRPRRDPLALRHPVRASIEPAMPSPEAPAR
jgi:hypothetical protein